CTFCTCSFFFQAEDGIRDRNVTGVQTCALPICLSASAGRNGLGGLGPSQQGTQRHGPCITSVQWTRQARGLQGSHRAQPRSDRDTQTDRTIRSLPPDLPLSRDVTDGAAVEHRHRNCRPGGGRTAGWRALARPRDGPPLPVVRARTFHVEHGLKEVVMNDRRYTFGVVVLSQGKRLEELNRGFESLLAQKGVELDIVCVGNGCEPEGIPDQVKKLRRPENPGIPAGRHAGVPHVTGEFLFFLDDDAWLPDDTTLMRMAQLMRTKPKIGLVQPRVEEPGGPDAPKRWIPRLKKGTADH